MSLSRSNTTSASSGDLPSALEMRDEKGTVVIGSREEYWIVFVPLCAYVIAFPIVVLVRALVPLFDSASATDSWTGYPLDLLGGGHGWFAMAVWLFSLWRTRTSSPFAPRQARRNA